MSNLPIVNFDPTGSKIIIMIHIGYSNWGSYSLYYFDKAGKNQHLIATGINTDEIPNQIETIEPYDFEAIQNRLFHWRVLTGRFDIGKHSQFHVNVQITQGENLLHEILLEDHFTGFTQELGGIIQFEKHIN